jgi:branched-chain amino acid transport system substrate-binding protein
MTATGPMSPTGHRSRRLAVVRATLAVLVASALLASSQAGTSTLPPIRIGAVFPLTGNAASLAQQTELGVQIAADLVNADGGVKGRRIELDVRDLDRGDDSLDRSQRRGK